MKTRGSVAICTAMILAASCMFAACGKKDETGSTPTPTPTPPPSTEPTAPVYRIQLDDSQYLLATQTYNTARAAASLTCDGKEVTGTIVYSVDDPTVAEVSADGTVTAVSVGKTILTASYSTADGTVTDTADINVLSPATASNVNKFKTEAVNLFGRTYTSPYSLVLDHVCTGFEVAFAGTTLTCGFDNSSEGKKIRVYIDGDEEGEEIILGTQPQTLAENLKEGVIHTARVLKATSPQFGKILLAESKALATDGEFFVPPEKPALKLEIIGDSITAGCGAVCKSSETSTADSLDVQLKNSDPTKALGFLAAQELNADFSIMALEGICVKDGNPNTYDCYTKLGYSNAGKYDTSTYEPDVIVLALGENDMWHATSSQFPNYNTQMLRQDYADMLRLLREKHPNTKILCIYGMMPASADSAADALFRSAIEDTGFDGVYYQKMKMSESGGYCHPDGATQKQNGKTLAAKIREILG